MEEKSMTDPNYLLHDGEDAPSAAPEAHHGDSNGYPAWVYRGWGERGADRHTATHASRDVGLRRPRCWNRPAFAGGAWMRSGYRGVRVVLRWVPRWFEDRCAVHDGRGIGPAGESYPVAHRFDCEGCRWRPRTAA